MLAEMAASVAVRAAVTGGIRALFAQNPDIIDLATASIHAQFPGIETEPALRQWTRTAAFDLIFERLQLGDRDFGDEIVTSFIEGGGFYLQDNDKRREAATKIVSTFLGALLGALLRGNQGIPTLANREERQHAETRAANAMHHAETRAENASQFDEMKELLAGLRPPADLALARIHRSKLEGAGCRAGGEFGGCGGVRRAVPERAGPLGGAEGAGAGEREACAGMLARASGPGRRCERASGRERYRP